MKEHEKCKKTSHHRPQCAKWFSRSSISKSGIWERWTLPFCRFSASFSIKYDVTDQYCKTMKNWKCNISGVFRLICLKLCRLLELGKEILLHFKFCCYNNQNQNYCLLLKRQKVYYLCKTDVRKVIWNNTVWLLLQVVSSFEEKWVIHSSYCEKTIVFCVWIKANYSCLSFHSNEIYSQAKFICTLVTACKIPNKSNKGPMRYCTLIFSMSRSIASMTSYLSQNEAKNLQNGDVHIAQIPDFKMEYLENHLAHWGQWWLVFFKFFMLFHVSLTFFQLEVPFNTCLQIVTYNHTII